jgi:hypothetical protein
MGAPFPKRMSNKGAEESFKLIFHHHKCLLLANAIGMIVAGCYGIFVLFTIFG